MREAASGAEPAQEQSNLQQWREGTHIADYDGRQLRPAETIILARYGEAMRGRVLELGCGPGRLLGYLETLAEAAHGIEVSPVVADYARARYPRADVRAMDLRDIARLDIEPLTVVWASYNVIDVVEPDTRLRLIADVRRLLAPGGLFVFSSHNLDAVEGAPAPAAPSTGRVRRLTRSALHASPAAAAVLIRRRLRHRRNRRRMRPLERRGENYAILNDAALDYGALHYYIRRDDQERQLADAGYRLIECLDLEGEVVASGQRSASTELHYIAEPAA